MSILGWQGCSIGAIQTFAAVALANKNARTAWALLAHDREFCAGYVPKHAVA
jgi:hypothetical protein